MDRYAAQNPNVTHSSRAGRSAPRACSAGIVPHMTGAPPVEPPGRPRAGADAEWPPVASGGSVRWMRPAVTLLLYALVFYWTDARALVARLGGARLEYVAAGVLLYVAGQAVSAWKWHRLL